VDIECGAVVGIFGNEGRHPDRLGIPPLLEQGIEVGVLDRPQRHLSHTCPPKPGPAPISGAEHTNTIGQYDAARCSSAEQRGVLVRIARSYDSGEIALLAAQARADLEYRRCPRCSHVGMRRYFQLFEGTARTSLITYLWCPACHGFDSSTVSGTGMKLDHDPMAELNAYEMRLVKANAESYIARLDAFWESEKLPQRLTE